MIRPLWRRYKWADGFSVGRPAAIIEDAELPGAEEARSDVGDCLSKILTFDEAQTLLPVLSSLLQRAREAALRAGTFESEMQSLSQRIFLSGGMHVDVAAAARRRAERDKAAQEARAIVEEMNEVGARLDDLAEGTLEIPCSVPGRTVLLCWTEGEAQIERWREDEEGSEVRRVAEGPFGSDRDRLQ